MTREKRAAFEFAHQANIDRYRRILATPLTAHERAFLERRIAEEQSSLEQISKAAALTRTSVDAA